MMTIFLVDGSGSMRPAWDAAWTALFNRARSVDTAFAVIIFKEKLTAMDAMTIADARNKGRDPLITNLPGLKLINYGDIIAATSRKIKRIPEPLITFSFRTPLNDAISTMIVLASARYQRTRVPWALVVVSDNRDTASLTPMRTVMQRITEARAQGGLRAVEIIAVGDFLNKYTEVYDRIHRVRG